MTKNTVEWFNNKSGDSLIKHCDIKMLHIFK